LLATICLTRRSVQSYGHFNPFLLDESGFPSAVDNRFRKYPVHDSLKKRCAMKKTALLSILVFAVLLAVGVMAEAQQQAKVAKIGWLSNSSATGTATSGLELTLRELRARGYVEGKNIAIEIRYAENKLERLPALADELVRLKVDVILTAGTPATLAAKNATKTIPIVFFGVGDPVPTGVVDSLSRPGGNITGLTEIPEVLAGKRLELLKETIPKLTRVAVLWNPQNPGNAQQWKESQLPARALGLQLHSMEVSSADKFESAFEDTTKARSAALAVTMDALFNFNQKQIANLAAKNRLPAIGPRRTFVELGGLMSYGADQAESFRRVASMIDKILKGTKPADLPIEQPTMFELMINLKTAKALGLTIPPLVLTRATKVIK
jgi:putative ABC transport system substrate-binding protein